jgi:two-component system sensor histidine kinase KdpD
MEAARPNPDALLAQVKAEEGKAARGQLKIFLGACAGVGKTYAMIEAARAARNEKVDVVVGLAETHGRRETEALLDGLEVLPRAEIPYRGVMLREFDLDAALRRQPQLILVDELAHTNAPGSRHPKRWQDIKELLDRGISVYTTLNIQHLESLNDVVAQVTGVAIQETVPDSFVQGADSIELVDLPFEELLKRLQEGKVYLGEQAERARAGFFRPGNLSALRELALRFTAEKVGRQLQELRAAQPGVPAWPTAERILVLVGQSPYSVRLIRHACRVAGLLHCDWIALNVETPAQLRLSRADHERTTAHLRLAAKLGAETATLSGLDAAQTAVRFARERNVTRIVVGKPDRRGLREWIFGSLTDRIVRESGDIAVIVARGDRGSGTEESVSVSRRGESTQPLRYLEAAAVVALCTLLGYPIYGRVDKANIVMLYLLGVVILSTRLGLWPAVFSSVLSVIAFDFFFVTQRFSFVVSDAQYLLTFLVMLAVAVVISTLTVRLRMTIEKSQLRERRTVSLHALSRKLAALRGQEAILNATVRHIAEIFDCEVVALLPDANGLLAVRASEPPGQSLDFKEQSVAQWTYDLGQMAGRGTDSLPSAERLYVPLLASHGPFGALGLKPVDMSSLMIPEQLQLLEAMSQQAALALEVDRLTEEAQRNQVQIETEQLRNALLSSVSHDLRTPLAVIIGSASSLLDAEHPLPESNRQDMLQTISEEAERLTLNVNNLLEMTRLQAGALNVRKELQPLEESIGSACQRLERPLKGRSVRIAIPPDLPLVNVDGALIEKVFFNLLDNAAKYTPEGTPVEIEVRREAQTVLVEVRDHGPGLGEGEEERIFDKFYRGATHGKAPGTGLGLAICQGIVKAHGGRIWAENRPDGGASFKFTIPLDTSAPAPMPEPPADTTR